jgi:hypothetical protein
VANLVLERLDLVRVLVGFVAEQNQRPLKGEIKGERSRQFG